MSENEVHGHALWVTKHVRPQLRGALRRDDARNLLRRTLESYARRDRLEVLAWAFLPARVELVITPPTEKTLPALMTDLFAYFTRRFNARYGTSGPIMRSRYTRRVLAGAEAITSAIEHVELLPSMLELKRRSEPWASGRSFGSRRRDDRAVLRVAGPTPIPIAAEA